MKFSILFAAAMSMAAPTSSAAVILTEITNLVGGEITNGNGNYIESGFTGYFNGGLGSFSITVRFGEDIYRRFDSLRFDYQTFGATNFEVFMSVFNLQYQNGGPLVRFATFQEPAATNGFVTKVIDLTNRGIGQNDVGDLLVASFLVTAAGTNFDNIAVLTQDRVALVPEPGSMFGVACLLGAGAFVRRRGSW